MLGPSSLRTRGSSPAQLRRSTTEHSGSTDSATFGRLNVGVFRRFHDHEQPAARGADLAFRSFTTLHVSEHAGLPSSGNVQKGSNDGSRSFANHQLQSRSCDDGLLSTAATMSADVSRMPSP